MSDAPWHVAVLGAGLAGLSAAHAIRRHALERGRAVELAVWEGNDRPGGQLRTTVEDRFVVEWGANAFRTGVGPVADLVARLGLQGEQVHADPAANRRYVFHGGGLHLLPGDPMSLLNFTPMSVQGRLRVMAEPFLAERVDHDESVHDYAARHIGAEAAEVLLGTMVRGVYGGDAHQLSVDAAFPVMREMERDHRSLVIAGIAGMKDRMRERKTTWSFRGGMTVLIDALAADLGDALHLGRRARSLTRDAAGGYHLEAADGTNERFDAVVLALPPRPAADLLSALDREAGDDLRAIPSGPIGMAALAFERSALRAAPDGFGFLVAPGEDLPVLGVLIESNVFPHRAPEGHVLLRAIQGGVARPDLDDLGDEALLSAAIDAIDRAWGIAAPPVRTWVGRQQRGIPQYVLGHLERLERLEGRLRLLGGLHVAGNAYRGIAVGKIVEDAEHVAAAVWDEVPAPAVA
ncbi:MAG: protoporphyrinogen oxidase [Trueperaceae bacterium]|nr:protoporphyrinogen oxidase [Trueperaceae bacterium]